MSSRYIVWFMVAIAALALSACGQTATATPTLAPTGTPIPTYTPAPTGVPAGEEGSPEWARDLAVQYVAEQYEDMESPSADSWSSEDLTPEGTVSSTTICFTSGDWEVTVQYPVVPEPDFTVEVKYPPQDIAWSGTVKADGSVTEAEE